METIALSDLIFIPSTAGGIHNIFSTTGTIVNNSGTKLLDIIEEIKEDEFVVSDFGIGGGREIDEEIRKSQIYKKMLKLELSIQDQPEKLVFDTDYEYVKYKLGGHFVRHSDRKRNENHTHAVLIYPPQDIIGGELALHFGTAKYIIKPSDQWTCIIFPIEIEHESVIVEKGEKKIIKGIGMTMP